MSCSAYVFDAYGTLFDVHSAARKHQDRAGGQYRLLSNIWRAKQLEYSWVLTLTDEYEDFWTLTERSLDFAMHSVGLLDKNLRADLLEAYWTLDCYPEVPRVLAALKARDAKVAILSNGTNAMIDAAVKKAGIETLIDDVFSAEQLRRFKPAPEVYDLAVSAYQVYPDAISFQSSNRWDIAGAANFGFRTVWVNRHQTPNEYEGMGPNLILPSLDGL
ncbi:haloacid dehalogenase type II [Martelella endophytica]|uniref:(S)-2-haloacid dehalogenase n=1 Tax=Martelella endophytica TaxID=1486262 RepID=A0A0D5LTF6_MAREN|nr:haloacid dehalogenase type II [Martelella endophytica]AJY47474.1 haloacid dehalogenase [Martelella endophytica]